MLDGFKKFILRGNVVDMAVGVVIGAAFGGVVTALTKDLLTPRDLFLCGLAGEHAGGTHEPRRQATGSDHQEVSGMLERDSH
jgi:large conductance mechanosensitive channel